MKKFTQCCLAAFAMGAFSSALLAEEELISDGPTQPTFKTPSEQRDGPTQPSFKPSERRDGPTQPGFKPSEQRDGPTQPSFKEGSPLEEIEEDGPTQPGF